MTNEQINQILDSAPEGATHILVDHEYHVTYAKRYPDSGNWFWFHPYSGWLEFDRMPTTQNIQFISDIREILALRDENKLLRARIERQQQTITGLEEWFSGIADSHNAIPDWIQQSARSLLASQAVKGGE